MSDLIQPRTEVQIPGVECTWSWPVDIEASKFIHDGLELRGRSATKRPFQICWKRLINMSRCKFPRKPCRTQKDQVEFPGGRHYLLAQFQNTQEHGRSQ